MARVLTTDQMLTLVRVLPPGAAFVAFIRGDEPWTLGLVIVAHPDIFGFQQEYYILVAPTVRLAASSAITDIVGVTPWRDLARHVRSLPLIQPDGDWRRVDETAAALLAQACDRLAARSERFA